jgi:uncharacterized membrane protein YgdD (TMEM256/DUF423 family)
MSNLLFRVSVLAGLTGILLGIAMGIRQDFSLMPVHAHLNLAGFVTLFLAALYYRAVPEAAASVTSRLHSIVAIVGAILFPAGIACVTLGDHERFFPVAVFGAITVLAGMLLFAVVVFRTTAPQALSRHVSIRPGITSRIGSS